MNLGILLFAAIITVGPSAFAGRIEFSWPTPNPAWEQGRGYEAWVQPTVSGDPESGLFGCVRSGGNQFHEGLDIRPIRRDRRGEPADPVMAAMDGVVRYVNLHGGDSSYGRYIVIEHTGLTPAVYTLYAHLARVEPGVKPFTAVKRGQVIGLMGHTAGGYAIPKERAHVHFEIGLVATTNFAAWYAWKRFGSPNEHGVYNGMNLMGIDPNDFLREYRRGRVDNFLEYFDKMRAVVRVRVATSATPDFIERYPSLLRRPLPPDGRVAGWEVECNSTGLPFAWTPLGPSEVAGMAPGTARIVAVDRPVVRAYRCKELVRNRGGQDVPAGDLAMMLQQVFGLR
ncbi:MAG TPA: M23 family metallopeptidase [Lacunisphaera sp.]|nr:M23 family metallopeptidase [Lacunisphaera sp.]